MEELIREHSIMFTCWPKDGGFHVSLSCRADHERGGVAAGAEAPTLEEAFNLALPELLRKKALPFVSWIDAWARPRSTPVASTLGNKSTEELLKDLGL